MATSGPSKQQQQIKALISLCYNAKVNPDEYKTRWTQIKGQLSPTQVGAIEKKAMEILLKKIEQAATEKKGGIAGLQAQQEVLSFRRQQAESRGTQAVTEGASRAVDKTFKRRPGK